MAKSKDRIQKLKETGDSSYIYQNELDKAFFQHNLPNSNFKNLMNSLKIASDKLLRDKAFHIAKTPKYDGYQRGFTTMACKFFKKGLLHLLLILLMILLKTRLHQINN